jgi:hypothetical protein
LPNDWIYPSITEKSHQEEEEEEEDIHFNLNTS